MLTSSEESGAFFSEETEQKILMFSVFPIKENQVPNQSLHGGA